MSVSAKTSRSVPPNLNWARWIEELVTKTVGSKQYSAIDVAVAFPDINWSRVICTYSGLGLTCGTLYEQLSPSQYRRIAAFTLSNRWKSGVELQWAMVVVGNGWQLVVWQDDDDSSLAHIRGTGSAAQVGALWEGRHALERLPRIRAMQGGRLVSQQMEVDIIYDKRRPSIVEFRHGAFVLCRAYVKERARPWQTIKTMILGMAKGIVWGTTVLQASDPLIYDVDEQRIEIKLKCSCAMVSLVCLVWFWQPGSIGG